MRSRAVRPVGLPIYVARIPSAPFASRQRKQRFCSTNTKNLRYLRLPRRSLGVGAFPFVRTRCYSSCNLFNKSRACLLLRGRRRLFQSASRRATGPKSAGLPDASSAILLGGGFGNRRASYLCIYEMSFGLLIRISSLQG